MRLELRFGEDDRSRMRVTVGPALDVLQSCAEESQGGLSGGGRGWALRVRVSRQLLHAEPTLLV